MTSSIEGFAWPCARTNWSGSDRTPSYSLSVREISAVQFSSPHSQMKTIVSPSAGPRASLTRSLTARKSASFRASRSSRVPIEVLGYSDTLPRAESERVDGRIELVERVHRRVEPGRDRLERVASLHPVEASPPGRLLAGRRRRPRAGHERRRLRGLGRRLASLETALDEHDENRRAEEERERRGEPARPATDILPIYHPE